VVSLIGDVYAAEEAWAHLESRYFESTPALCPDLAADWQRLRDQAEELALLGDLLGITAPTIEGRRHRHRRPQIDLRQLRAAARDRAPEEAKSLVEAARSAALDALGDTEGAISFAVRRLRQREDDQPSSRQV